MRIMRPVSGDHAVCETFHPTLSSGVWPNLYHSKSDPRLEMDPRRCLVWKVRYVHMNISYFFTHFKMVSVNAAEDVIVVTWIGFVEDYT